MCFCILNIIMIRSGGRKYSYDDSINQNIQAFPCSKRTTNKHQTSKGFFTFKPFNLSTAFGKGSICFLSFEQFAGVSGKSNEVFEYMSRTFDVTHVSPSIGPFFNLIPGISPQRRNEMEVGSKLRDKSDLVSNRRHYIQTLPRFVLLYFGTPPKRGKSIQPKISAFSEELLKFFFLKNDFLFVLTFANPGPQRNLYLLHFFHIFY